MTMNSIFQNAGAAVCLALFALLGTQVHARDLLADYQKALQFDPQYQTALADLTIAQRGAKQAKSVFYPQATWQTKSLDPDAATRT